MFDLPAAKRVRRADLYSPAASPEPSQPDEELRVLLHSQLENAYGPVVIDRQLSSQEQNNEHGELDPSPSDPQRGFEFRLFATPANKLPVSSHDPNGAAPAARIILDDELDAGDSAKQGGFVVPRRAEGYYFTDAVTPERRKERRREFEIAAVSEEEVRRWLGVRYSGWEVRWRVRHLRNGELVVGDGDEKGHVAAPLAAGLAPDGHSEMGLGIERRKCKPGKKRRIILRTKKRKAEEAALRRREEAEKKKMTEKEREEAEREKRTRRNREKKIKKRAREREKKTKGGDGGVDSGE